MLELGTVEAEPNLAKEKIEMALPFKTSRPAPFTQWFDYLPYHFKPLYVDTSEASKHRQSVELGIGNDFYAQQERMAKGWGIGQPVPDGLIIEGCPSYNIPELRIIRTLKHIIRRSENE